MTDAELKARLIKPLSGLYDNTSAHAVVDRLADEVVALRAALNRYAGRKLKFHKYGGGTTFYGEWDLYNSTRLPFFGGEEWCLGAHAEEALEESNMRLGIENEGGD